MKLIILNGACGAGKSTLAARLHTDVPMSLLVVVDEWRKLISEWREHRKESQVLGYKIAWASVDAYLADGHDVIVDKSILNDYETLKQLVRIGEAHGADVFEFIITASKEVVMERATERGFNPNGLLTLEGVEHLWELSQGLVKERPNAIVIDTSSLSPDEVYEKVKDVVQ